MKPIHLTQPSLLITPRTCASIAATIAALGLAACNGDGDGSSAGANDPGGVAFNPEFPKPMFQGTPVNADLPNLEKPGEPTTELTVAEGTEIVSIGKPVTGSDDLPTIGDLSFVTDGDKDGSDGYYVELGPDVQWVQIDLEAPHTIEGLGVWHFHKNARAYKDVVIQISDDETFGSGVTTVYNNDHDNSAGAGVGEDMAYVETNHGRLIDANGVTGRYVRLYSNGNTTDDLNHYVEVEVYGKPAA